jgi:hypothetical protein
MAGEEKDALMEPVVVPPGQAPVQFGILGDVVEPVQDRVRGLEERVARLEKLVYSLAGHSGS